MLFVRYSLILFGLLLINNNCAFGTDEISITTESIFDEAIARILQLREKYNKDIEQIKKDKKQLEIDRQKFHDEKEPVRSIYETDVIHLNIAGELIATTRQTLTSIPKSLFAILFNGRWEHKLQRDDDGIIFFDFNPVVFRHLLDQLQLSPINRILPPTDPSLVRPFEKMLKNLRLQYLLSTSNKHIMTINVDGQVITTLVSNSTENNLIMSSNPSKILDKTDVFIDYHPKIIRHFVKFRREKKFIEIHCENKSFVQPIFNNWTTSCYEQISVLTKPENNLRKHDFELFKNHSTKDIHELQTQMKDQQQDFTKELNKQINLTNMIEQDMNTKINKIEVRINNLEKHHVKPVEQESTTKTIQLSNTLYANTILWENNYLVSTNKAYYAVMQGDGNFVIYISHHFVPKNSIWNSETGNRLSSGGPYHIIMQGDGNLVIYGVHGSYVCDSKTGGKGSKPHKFIMQDDGNLVLYDANSRAHWYSGTGRS